MSEINHSPPPADPFMAVDGVESVEIEKVAYWRILVRVPRASASSVYGVEYKLLNEGRTDIDVRVIYTDADDEGKE